MAGLIGKACSDSDAATIIGALRRGNPRNYELSSLMGIVYLTSSRNRLPAEVGVLAKALGVALDRSGELAPEERPGFFKQAAIALTRLDHPGERP
jgi:hypothetical protein